MGKNSDANGGIYQFLWCGGTNLQSMLPSPIGHSLPDIVDDHVYPGSDAGTTDAYVQQVAGLDYSDLEHFFPLLGLSFQSTALVIGETYSAAWTSSCSPVPFNWSSAFPAENVSGFNVSSLAGNPIVFRPWLELEDPTGVCYPYPSYQNINGLGGGPYTPTQQ